MLHQIPLILVILPVLVTSRLYTLDDNKPYISSDSSKVNFFEGGGAFLLHSNVAVRFTYRGIQSITYGNSIIPGSSWIKLDCNISAFSACAYSHGHLFSSERPHVGYHRLILPQLQCVKSQGKEIVLDPMYDISACDILEESYDVIYTQNTMYIQLNYMSTWEYWALVIGSIYLVRSISLNIMSKYNGTPLSNQSYILLVATVLVILVLKDGDRFQVTANDILFYWVNMVYIGLYMCYHMYHWAKHYIFHLESTAQPMIFNASAACLQLVASRLYSSAETPYTVVILALVSSRVWEKEMSLNISHKLTGMLDCCFVSLLITVGFTYNTFYLIPLFMSSWMVAQMIHLTSLKKKEDKKEEDKKD